MKKKQLLSPPTHTLHIEEDNEGQRIDKVLASKLPQYSRSFFKRLLEEDRVRINGIVATKPSIQLKAGDTIEVIITPIAAKDKATIQKDLESLPIKIIYENDQFLVVNKPAGLLVHNTESDQTSTTLVDWLLLHDPQIKQVGESDRPGIVHRLDKNTSGIMVVAKTDHAYKILTDLFKNRAVEKVYHALVKGHPDKTGTINLLIGRHPAHRHKFITYKTQEDAQKQNGKTREAETHYHVIHYLPDTTMLEIKPTTGRTHQIRVHLAAIGHPILGDHIYGSASKLIDRHALHAQSLSFTVDGKPYTFSCEPPHDFMKAYKALQ